MPTPDPSRLPAADVLGHRMVLPDPARDRFIGPALSAAGVFEPVQTELLLHLVRPGDVALDLGAHVGYFTLLLARLVGPGGCVYAFEPDPDNFALLRHNVAANGYQNVVACPLAVSDRCGDARLFLSPDNTGDHQLYASAGGRGSVGVQAVTLDRYFEKYPGRVDVIKMDVQGCEHAALAGMRALVSRHDRLLLLAEFWPWGLTRAGAGPGGYLRDLELSGFALWDVREDAAAVQRTTPARLLEAYPSHPDRFTNLLAVRSPVRLRRS